jgi:hypothetical protein
MHIIHTVTVVVITVVCVYWQHVVVVLLTTATAALYYLTSAYKALCNQQLMHVPNLSTLRQTDVHILTVSCVH